MTKREQSIVIGCVLGDGYLQRTGSKNARLRLEHSVKQKDYIFWKWQELKRYMQDRPKILKRFNPVWKKQHVYYRCQSHASPEFGKLRAIFYPNTHRQIPEILGKLLQNSLTLAVWFMDDGYYYRRDCVAYLYLSRINAIEEQTILNAFSQNYKLKPKCEKKKTGNCNLKFSAADSKQLVKIIAPHIIPSMRYKLGEEPRID